MDVGTKVFGQLNGLNFTMQQASANPLPQVITVTSTGAAFDFSVAASTATGGNWLTVSPSGNCCVTSEAITVTVNAPPTLAAGIYTGEISFYTGGVSQTVPVTLTVAPSTGPFFDNVPGALNYSLAVQSGNPAAQSVQIRNRGAGTLNWTARPFTVDGGNWLTVSASSGAAPTLVNIGIVTQSLPNAGLVAGLFTGQVLFLAGDSSSVTVPVSVLVGGNGFAQVNGISLTMPVNGANPLPQILTTTSIGSNFDFSISANTGNGGSWMTVSPTGDCCASPTVVTVSVAAPAGLAAGTYTGEVILNRTTSAAVVPVTLTVAPANLPFFDNVQGQMSFFGATGTTPASQTMQLFNAGSGELDWTLAPMTASNGNWLTLSTTSGTAPSSVTVGVNISNLPNQGLVAGQFTGQLLYQSSTGSVTVPVSLQLGANTFTQDTGLSFSMPYAGSSPLSQTEVVSSTGSNFDFSAAASSGNGGNWLSITPTGDCCATPTTVTFKVNGAPGGTPVPAGVHTGQAVFNAGGSAMTVPVILNVSGTPKWSISKTHTGNFSAGQTNATYTVTVSNQSGSGIGFTSGTATVTETAPTGMTLVSMAGTGWSCVSGGNTCSRNDSIGPGGSYPPITVTVNVSATASQPLTNSVGVSGGSAGTATANDVTGIVTRCDLNQDGMVSLTDVQIMINSVLGAVQTGYDVNRDGVLNVADIQILVDAALNKGCPVM